MWDDRGVRQANVRQRSSTRYQSKSIAPLYAYMVYGSVQRVLKSKMLLQSPSSINGMRHVDEIANHLQPFLVLEVHFRDIRADDKTRHQEHWAIVDTRPVAIIDLQVF